MFIDTSVFVAILRLEADYHTFSNAIDLASTRLTSPLVRLETMMVMSRFNRGDMKVNEFHFNRLLADFKVEIVPLTDEMARSAVAAFAKFGKGQKHPAQLNLADCMSYAAAKILKQPLLFKGNDFSRTDIRNVLK